MQLTKPSSTSSNTPLSRPICTSTWKQSNARSRWPIDSKWSAASSSRRTLATIASRACARVAALLGAAREVEVHERRVVRVGAAAR